MKSEDSAGGDLPETAPVFPLPNTVLFPRTVLPLHIFEPRYRQMTARALETNGYIAMALRRGESEPEGYHSIGCLGRICDSKRLDDGRYVLQLVGLRKVVFSGEIEDGNAYLTARIVPVAESVPPDDDTSHQDLVRLLGACTVLFQEVSDREFPMVSIKRGLPYEAVVNSICFHIGLPVEVKQSLLEEDDLRARCLKLTDSVNAYLQKIVLSRGTEPREEGDELVN